jgi:uncharacterized protein YuzE
MLRFEHDAEADAYYVQDTDEHGFTADVCRTEELGSRTVNVDFDRWGNVIGVEIL